MTSPRSLRRAPVLAAVATAVMLASAGNALALSGKPIKVGTPLQSGRPALVVDAAGTAVIAWANTKDLPPNTTNVVQYCVIPAGASACAHSGTLTPADGAQYIDNVQVLFYGAAVVILADVYGTTTLDYTPEQEWISTDGGATFAIAAGGASVASGILSADTQPVSGIIVPGTDALGYGWVTAGGPPTFDEFPLVPPTECSRMACPGSPFATLEPNTNPDQVTNPAGSQYASQLGANPGVLAIFPTLFSNGPLGCTEPGTVGDFGTAYAYGSGAQSAANSYDISPGTLGSAWKVPVAQADCGVEYPAVGGGPSGFGVVEHNIAAGTTVYHRFNPATMTFNTPQVTIAKEGELSPSVSQDGAGGIYATYLGGGSGGPLRLAYSSDGGAVWSGPGTLNPNTGGSANSLTSSVAASGQGWAAWIDNGSIFAQQFVATDAVTPPSLGASGSSKGGSVTITVTCASTPCTVTITITIDPPASAARAGAGAAKAKIVKLASGKFTIRHKGKRKLTVRLTKAGKKFLAAHHGHVKGAKLVASLKVGGHLVTATRTIRITAGKKK